MNEGQRNTTPPPFRLEKVDHLTVETWHCLCSTSWRKPQPERGACAAVLKAPTSDDAKDEIVSSESEDTLLYTQTRQIIGLS